MDELESPAGSPEHAAMQPGNSTQGSGHEARERLRGRLSQEMAGAGELAAAAVRRAGMGLLLQIARATQAGDRELRSAAAALDAQRTDTANA